MHLLPPARADGLSANAGRVPQQVALLAGGLGIVALLPLGLPGAIWAAAALGLGLFLMKGLCERQIGGQTGDILGAVEQISEIIVLLIACVILT
jgi:adenosylcobinamide-GDP ribazoletransferase